MNDGDQNVANESVEKCARCGERIDVNKWHTATMRQLDEGEIRIHSFCSESCRDNWEG